MRVLIERHLPDLVGAIAILLGISEAVIAAVVTLYPPTDAEKAHWIVWVVGIGVVQFLLYFIAVLWGKSRERRERDADRHKLSTLESRAGQHSQNLATIQVQLKTLHSNRLKVEGLPHGLRRDTLELSNDLLAAWAEHEATRPPPAAFAAGRGAGDSHEAWAKERQTEWEWNQKFFRAFQPEFSARVLSIIQRLGEKGYIKEDDLKTMEWRFISVGPSTTDDVRSLAQRLGAIALNMESGAG